MEPNAKHDRAVETLGVKKAGTGYQVTTLRLENSGKLLHRKQPCEECPWRIDADIGAFPAEAFRLSANTAQDLSGHLFSCHMSGTCKPAICAGFLLRGADDNMAVRMAAAVGLYDPGSVSSEVELYDSYRDMAEANGVSPMDPALPTHRRR